MSIPLFVREVTWVVSLFSVRKIDLIKNRNQSALSAKNPNPVPGSMCEA